MNNNSRPRPMDYGPVPFVINVSEAAAHNKNFRTAVWTGEYMQMTLMSIPAGGEIGWEIHEDTDQFIRIEHGNAAVQIGMSKGSMSAEATVGKDDAAFIPAGTWHNVMNRGDEQLKISTIYAPPHHPWGTVQRTVEEAQESEQS